MRLKATVTTDHPILFISDPANPFDLPPGVPNPPVSANRHCVSVVTRVPASGETTIELATSIRNPAGPLIFEGELITPSRKLTVAGSDTVPILSMDVSDDVTPLKIWANDTNDPYYIQILAQADFSDVLPYAAAARGKGMDRRTAERLSDAVKQLDLVNVQFNAITANIGNTYQKNRIDVAVLTAIHDIQECISGEIASQFPDFQPDDSEQ